MEQNRCTDSAMTHRAGAGFAYCTGVYGSNSPSRVTPLNFEKLATEAKLRVTGTNLGNRPGALRGKPPFGMDMVAIVAHRTGGLQVGSVAEDVWAYDDNGNILCYRYVLPLLPYTLVQYTTGKYFTCDFCTMAGRLHSDLTVPASAARVPGTLATLTPVACFSNTVRDDETFFQHCEDPTLCIFPARSSATQNARDLEGFGHGDVRARNLVWKHKKQPKPKQQNQYWTG
ncbi:hypothetical protein B0H19DRAFT_1062560 [Mycena capillaripes]|nr:hypothetical protein B0H19DRAFT_1062560 [Mycena capillaripes]